MSKTLIVAPLSAHKFLLNKHRKDDIFSDVKIVSREQLFSMYYGKYDENCLLYIMEHENVSYSSAKIFLNELIYVTKDDSTNIKISYLYKLKEKLIKENLLIIDDLNMYELSQSFIKIYFYSCNDVTLFNIVKPFNYEFIEFSKDISKLDVLSFDTYENQLLYVFNEICELINKGVSYNDIFLYGVEEDDLLTINRISRNFGLNINYKKNISLAKLPYGAFFLKNFFSCNIDDLLNELKTKFDNNENDIEEFIFIIKFYYNSSLDKNILYKNYNQILNDKKRSSQLFKEGIKVLNEPTVFEGQYLFILKFNENQFPTVYKDEQYLSDEEKIYLDLSTSKQLNEDSKYMHLQFLQTSGNLNISFSKSRLSQSTRPTFFINEYKMNVIRNPLQDYIYSSNEGVLYTAKLLDYKNKYLQELMNYDDYNNTFPIIYKSYNNNFKGSNINQEIISLSYSSMQSYNKCAYSYYLSHILKIDDIEESFYILLGKISHYVLQHINDFDYDVIFESALKKENINDKKTLLLFKRIKELLKLAYNHINNFEQHIIKPIIEREKAIKIKISDDFYIKGILDKIIISGIDNEYISVIDYKTGLFSFNPSLAKLGLDLQLPVYIYLLKKSPEYKNYKILGVYIQKLIMTSITQDVATYEKYLRLCGQTLKNKDAILSIDKEFYEDNSFIEGISLKKDGEFTKSSKVEDDEWFKDMEKLAEEFFNKSYIGIKNKDFSINPKMVNGSDHSCKYCGYKDICFRNMSNYTFLQKDGDDNEVE